MMWESMLTPRYKYTLATLARVCRGRVEYLIDLKQIVLGNRKQAQLDRYIKIYVVENNKKPLNLDLHDMIFDYEGP